MNFTERNLEEQARKIFNEYLAAVLTEETAREIRKQSRKIAQQIISQSVVNMWETSSECGIEVKKKF